MKNFEISRLLAYRKVHFVLRDDFQKKSGGDVDLAKTIMGIAQGLGANCTIAAIGEPPHLGVNEAVFAFNYDRPFEAFRALSGIPNGAHFFFYTLHHPSAGVEAYLRVQQRGRGTLARISGFHPASYEALVDIVKAIRSGSLSRLRFALNRKHHLAQVLEQATLLVVSENEFNSIKNAHPQLPSLSAEKLPHPLSLPATPRLGKYALIAGRIEPRKNQLNAIRRLAESVYFKQLDLQLVVVGGAGTDDKYYREVLEACAEHKFVYISHLPRDLFNMMVKSAEIVINPSYFEVSSLIDLLAIGYGRMLLTTIYSYYEPVDNVHAIDPANWDPSEEIDPVSRLLIPLQN